MSDKPDVHAETEAMKAIMRALERLPKRARVRIIDMVDQWFEDMDEETEE